MTPAMSSMSDRLLLRQLAFGLAPGVLGAAGNRMGVWTYGCSLPRCFGCTSAQTWHEASAADAHWVDVAALLHLAVKRNPGGMVLSGGEPSDQATGCTLLASGFKALYPEREVVLYSGLRWGSLQARFPDLVAAVDVVVAGPYVQTLPANALAGSSNQEVRLLTPLARKLFKGWESWPLHRLQVASQTTASGDTEIITVGIPENQRVSQAAQRLTKSSVQQVSWLPRSKEAHPLGPHAPYQNRNSNKEQP